MCKGDSEIWVVALQVTSLLSAVWRGLGETLDHNCYMLCLLIQNKGSNILLDASWLEQIWKIICTICLMPDILLRLPGYLRSCVIKFRGYWNIHSLRPALFGKAEESKSDPLKLSRCNRLSKEYYHTQVTFQRSSRKLELYTYCPFNLHNSFKIGVMSFSDVAEI